MATTVAPNTTETRVTTQENRQQQLRKIMRSEETISRFTEIMSKENAMAYISGVLLTVANTPALQECTPQSIIVSAMRAATLRLSCDPATGQAYLVPFKNKVKGKDGEPDKWVSQATLVVGYRGLEQLAMRTGKYRTINVFPVYEGQEYVEDQLTGKSTVKGFKKPGAKVIGYGLYFELVPYFSKTFYMTVEEILAHGEQYSKTFKYDSSLWKTEPDKMMRKTVLRLGLSRYGYMDPFDRMTLAQVDDSERAGDDENQIDGTFTETEAEPAEPQETTAEKEARLVGELTGEPPKQAEPAKENPLAKSPIADLKKERDRLMIKDQETGLSQDEINSLTAIKAELQSRK